MSVISGKNMSFVDIPYIKDGLIGMWDGEWNAGIGHHDLIPKVQKDLVGSSGLSSRPCKCQMFCLRIYNKNLSTNEVIQNWLIDKRRFTI